MTNAYMKAWKDKMDRMDGFGRKTQEITRER